MPQGYKLTEVGVIPEDWDVVHIKDMGEIDSDTLKGSTNPNYAFDYISLEQIHEGVLTGTQRIKFKESPSRARRVLKEKDVLISTVRPNLKSHYFVNCLAQDLICSTGFSVIRMNANTYNPLYLFFHLFGFLINKQIDAVITGSNYPAINNDHVKRLLVPIPVLSEQTAIANALSDIDTLIQSIKKLINKKQAIKTAAMQQLLTGKKRLPEFAYREDGTLKSTKQSELGEIPEDWEVYSINQLCLYQNGISLEKYFNQNSGYKVISIGNYSNKGKYIHNNTYIDFSYKNLIRKFILKKGDLSVLLNDKTSTGMIIGRGILVCYDNQYVINQRSMILRPNDKILSLYFYFLINSDLMHKMIVAKAKPGTQIYVNTHDILDLPMLVTLNKVEQTAIAIILSDMDKEIEALQARLHKTEHIKQGMMQELLTGKTRLVTPV